MDDRQLTGERVLVTGAGCVGSRLVERLQRAGAAEIRVIDAVPERLETLGAGVVGIAGDLEDRATIQRALDGVGIVFHTAAVLEGNDVDRYYRVNHRATAAFAEAAAAAGVRRFVHLSSIAVYGFPEGDVIEDQPLTPSAQAYSRSKALGEQAVQAVGERTGMGVAVIRPAAIFGPGARYFTGTYMQRALKRPIRMVGSGYGTLAVTFVDDVVDLMITTASHPAAVGEAFHCAIDPPPTHREYLHAYGALVGNETWFGFPAWLVAGASSIVVPFSKRETYARQLPRNVRQLEKTFRYSMDKARDLLGWKPSFDVEAGVQASIPWLREEGFIDGSVG